MKNQPTKNNKTYTIITSDFLLKGFDIPFLKEGVTGVKNIYKPSKDELGYGIRKAVVSYLKSL